MRGPRRTVMAGTASVMAGLVPAICATTGDASMAGTRPAMTEPLGAATGRDGAAAGRDSAAAAVVTVRWPWREACHRNPSPRAMIPRRISRVPPWIDRRGAFIVLRAIIEA